MFLIVGIVGIAVLLAVAWPGVVVVFLAARSLRDGWLLRKRGIRANGIAQRKASSRGTRVEYRFIDAAGLRRVVSARSSASLARDEPSEIELCYDPLGRAQAREAFRSPAETAGTLLVLAVALWWLWTCGVQLYGLATSHWDLGSAL